MNATGRVELVTDMDEWQLTLDGDGRALARVFHTHRSRVRSHLLRIVPVPADAEDALAMVFFEAWRKRRSVRFVDGSLLPWLLTTATNVARNLQRSARRYRLLLERLPDPEPPNSDPTLSGDVAFAFRSLARVDQEVLALCVLEGFSQRAAAAALGLTEVAVKSRLARARAHLAARLALEHPSPQVEGTPSHEH